MKAFVLKGHTKEALKRLRNAVYTPPYPRAVMLGLHNKCNLLCLFCHREKDLSQVTKTFEVPLATVKKMEWLKHIRTIDISSGVIEPLMHSEFAGLMEHLGRSASAISVTTNGLLFNERNINALLDQKTVMKISVNAGRKETYERMMKNARWDILNRNLELLQRIRSGRKSQARVRLGFVVMRENVQEIGDFLELAARVGVPGVYIDQVKVYHSSQILPEQSMYSMKEVWNRAVPLVLAKAEKLGLSVLSHVAPFPDAESEEVNFEAALKGRSKSYCGEPYSTLVIQKVMDDSDYLEVSICGNQLVQPLFVRVEDILTRKQFQGLWQDIVFKKMRRTCNTGAGNPLCNTCKANDKRLVMASNRYIQTYAQPEILEFLSQSPRAHRS